MTKRGSSVQWIKFAGWGEIPSYLACGPWMFAPLSHSHAYGWILELRCCCQVYGFPPVPKPTEFQFSIAENPRSYMESSE